MERQATDEQKIFELLVDKKWNLIKPIALMVQKYDHSEKDFISLTIVQACVEYIESAKEEKWVFASKDKKIKWIVDLAGFSVSDITHISHKECLLERGDTIIVLAQTLKAARQARYWDQEMYLTNAPTSIAVH